jgi:hypothetical protein
MKVVGEIGGLAFRIEFHPLLQTLLPYFLKIMPQTKKKETLHATVPSTMVQYLIISKPFVKILIRRGKITKSQLSFNKFEMPPPPPPIC